ncbi:GNAT family N-acetyltransferase [Kitasatospora sp. NPDC127111]|uniref:GNAT family N-acetyltransferase n=1 Tax=Kitasatospora sp. NPDC127111 TaxID=3345363 RepID=UPI00362BB066
MTGSPGAPGIESSRDDSVAGHGARRTTAVDVRRVDRTALLGRAADVRDVYAQAFGRPPWNEPAHLADEFLDRLGRDADRPGFTAAAARRADGRLVGFATAWTTPEPFPSEGSYRHATEGLGERGTRDLLGGALKIDELAVHPDHAGQGLGTALLNAVSAAAPRGRLWLFTTAAAGGPLDFYLRHGWRPVTRPAPHPDGVVVLLGPRHPGAPAAALPEAARAAPR